MADKKKSFDLLVAVGKNGPKSKNMSGVSDSSISAPDQSGDEMAPGGGIDEELMTEEPVAPEPEMPMTPEEHENCITLPQGFKAPDGSEDGKAFTTTVRGHIMDGKFYPESIGDMPLDNAQAAPPPAGEEMMNDYATQKAEEKAANAVFQPGR